MKHWRYWIYCYAYIHIVLDLYLQYSIAVSCVHMDLPSICKCFRCFLVKSLYKPLLFSCTPAASVTQTPHDKKENEMLSLGSACACHRLLHSARCLNENVFIVLSKSERAFVALCFSVKASVLREEQHTPQRCVNV